METQKKDNASRLWRTIVNIATSLMGIIAVPASIFSILYAFNLVEQKDRWEIAKVKL